MVQIPVFHEEVLRHPQPLKSILYRYCSVLAILKLLLVNMVVACFDQDLIQYCTEYLVQYYANLAAGCRLSLAGQQCICTAVICTALIPNKLSFTGTMGLEACLRTRKSGGDGRTYPGWPWIQAQERNKWHQTGC
jgi:hypothetical protein